jgi:dolichyl-diphosphooligosaccharide--protein glycosyltransferase
MQFTAVFIKQYIVGDYMSLNDVCCYIPAWFGVFATFITGLIAYECTLECNSSNTILSVLSNMIFNSNDNGASTNNANGTGTGNISNNLKQKAGDPLVPIVAMLFTMMAMAVIPAHLMRSVGGGFDNESVAMSAMTMTFYFWIRSLRTGEDKSYLWGVLTGLAYFYVSIVNCRMMDGCLTRAQFSYCICLLYSISLIVIRFRFDRWLQHGGVMCLS